MNSYAGLGCRLDCDTAMREPDGLSACLVAMIMCASRVGTLMLEPDNAFLIPAPLLWPNTKTSIRVGVAVDGRRSAREA